MTTPCEPVNLDDVMAYVDGQLEASRRRQVEELAARDASLAQTLVAYIAQRNALRDGLAGVVQEPVPQRLLESSRPSRFRAVRLAAAVATLLIGAGAGSLATLQLASQGHPVLATSSPQGERGNDLPRFVHQAAVAHAVFTPEARRPVEIGADQEPALGAWLSKRLGRRLQAPSRLPQGFALMGGRLLPGEPDKPAAQLMYEDSAGRRLTVYLRGMAQPTPETAFRYGERNGVGTFYWVDRDWGYALSGELPRAELLQIAEAVYDGVTAGQ